jgi:hypothetical protein
MKTYDYQPGNGTRYFLAYGPMETGRGGTNDLLVWLRRNDVGGTVFRVMAHFSVIHQGYFMEKTGIENEADAAALLGFLEQQGHSIDIISNHDSRGRWIANDLAFTGGAADV